MMLNLHCKYPARYASYMSGITVIINKTGLQCRIWEQLKWMFNYECKFKGAFCGVMISKLDKKTYTSGVQVSLGAPFIWP